MTLSPESQKYREVQGQLWQLQGQYNEQVEASFRADDATRAMNLARYEQELFALRNATNTWCSERQRDLPPVTLDPDRAACPANVSGLNPYANGPFVVYRLNAAQTPTDGSSGLRRITVKVKRIMSRSGSSITAVEPVVTVITYQVPGVTFGA